MIHEEYRKLVKPVTSEIAEVLSNIAPGDIETLYGEITKAGKIFITAAGRSLLSLKCMAMRLTHLGFNVQQVGSVTAQPVAKGDLLLIASGSGRSKITREFAAIARANNARVGVITSTPESGMKDVADFTVCIPSHLKVEPRTGTKSIQAMWTLFDQSLHVFGDILCRIIQTQKGLKDSDLWARHANLE